MQKNKAIYRFTIVVIFIFQLSFSGFTQKISYQRVEIPYDPDVLLQVQSLGIEVDNINQNQMMVLEIDENEVKLLKNAKMPFKVTINDLETFYRKRNSGKKPTEILNQQRNSKEYSIPEGFSFGSMGGYCTLNEVYDHLDFMVENYPDLISPKAPAADMLTVEGREVYWLRISDNPLVNENETEILYTALTHAREPGSVQQMLFFMYYLLENYETDSLVKSLVDNNELYFIPCVNPDGYVYNETTNPEGGGMWRKNRRLVATNTYGVDLNRNFGYKWGYDNYGSSPAPSSSTYRGPSAFSEQETKIIRNFCIDHQFVVALNYHTHGQYFLHPWGYVSYLYPTDYQVMQDWARLLTWENYYRFGNAGSLLYLVNGDINDYLYGEVTEKSVCLGFTPEVGSSEDGFWPDMEEIIPQCYECLHMNLMAAQLAGYHFTLTDLSPLTIPSHDALIDFQIKRNGLKNAPVTVSVVPLTDNFLSVEQPKSISLSDILSLTNDSLQISLGPGIKPGDTISYVLKATCEYFVTTDTVIRLFGNTTVAFSDDCNTIEHWVTDDWIVTSQNYFSPSASVISTSGSYYPNNKTSLIRISEEIDLSDVSHAWFRFHARWELDGGQDYVRCVLSTTNGQSWQNLSGIYTTTNFVNNQPLMPVYAGKQTSWVQETIDLSVYCGYNILLGFYFRSDGSIGKTGFNFDDVSVETLEYQPALQEISIPEGWSSISGYLIPEETDMNEVFSNLSGSLEVIIHNDLFFEPGNSQSTLIQWNSMQGYKAKFSQHSVLQLSGYPEIFPYIQLNEGWNLVPVVKQTPVFVEQVFTEPAGKILLIRDVVGQSAYWPDQQINSLQQLIPGKSYFIEVSDPCKLFY